MNEKEKLRKKYIGVRNKIVNKEKKSLIISKKVIDNNYFINAKVVALYKSLKSEVNTDYLINYLLEKGKIVLLPRVVLDNIVFLKYSNGDVLEKSKFGVMEPAYNLKNIFDDIKIDLIIVPGVAFTSDGNRLGFGKGYYDRFLSRCKKRSIGICFKEQLCSFIPTDRNDYKLDEIITD